MQSAAVEMASDGENPDSASTNYESSEKDSSSNEYMEGNSQNSPKTSSSAYMFDSHEDVQKSASDADFLGSQISFDVTSTENLSSHESLNEHQDSWSEEIPLAKV